MVFSAEEKRKRKNAADRARYKDAGILGKAKRNAADRARYKDARILGKAKRNAADRARYKDAGILGKAKRNAADRARYPVAKARIFAASRKPENIAKKKAYNHKREKAYFEKHGRYCNSSFDNGNANLALLLTDFVRGIKAAEKIFPDKHKAKNMSICDSVVAGLVAGLMLTPKSKLDQSDVNDKALLSLVDGCDEENPEEAAFLVVDTEYIIPNGSTVIKSATEAAVGVYNHQGVRMNGFSIKKESGVLDEDDWNDVKAFIVKHGEGLPLFCWGSAELPLFRHLERPDGVDAIMVLRKAFPALAHKMRSEGIGGDPKKRFSMSMDFLTAVFGMGGAAFHEAMKDCDGEAVIIAAFGRYIAGKW